VVVSNPVLLRRCPPCTVSFLTTGDISCCHRRGGIAHRDYPRGEAPRPLAETGFRLGFRPTLKLCARSGAPRSLAGFTRPEASAALLAFPSSRVFLPGRPGPYGPPLMRFESRCKVLLRPEMTPPCGDISPHGVSAF